MKHYTWKEKFQYRFDNLMSRGTASLIGILFGITALVVIVAGVLVTVLHQGGDWDVGKSMWMSLMHAIDAGTLAANDFNNQFIPHVYEDISKQFLIIRNKLGLIKPAFSEIGTYYYDDANNKKNGQFDVVTLDNNGYIFYEVKFTNSLIGESILNEEVYQLKSLNINYYKLGFISKNCSSLDKNIYNLYDLNDVYGIEG